ncbi:MAG: tetratricopeptide repeat protein, partial [Sediminispirochaetaceae bacterium]
MNDSEEQNNFEVEETSTDIVEEMPQEEQHEGQEELPEEQLNEISELSKRGYQLLKENLINDAEDCFRQILEYDDVNNYALVGLGDAARKRGDFRKAISYYQQCLENHEGNNYALFGLADCYKALNRYTDA